MSELALTDEHSSAANAAESTAQNCQEDKPRFMCRILLRRLWPPWDSGAGKESRHRARSATSASSTIMPAGVARRRELPSGATSPSSCNIESRDDERPRPESVS